MRSFPHCLAIALVVHVSTTSAQEPTSAIVPASPAAENSDPSAYCGSGMLTGLTPGSIFTFQTQLSPAEQKLAKEDGNPGADTATVGLCVPTNFTPAKKWPILIVFTTSDGNFSHVARLKAFARTANDCGWVVLAADGPAKPPEISAKWCWAMLSAGLAVLEKEWPDVKKWPMACGGNSGGAKMSALMAALLASEKFPVVGVFMGGCNEDLLSIGLREFHPPATFKKIAAFLSVGTADKKASPAKVAAVAASMKAAGFRNLRLESYDGGHQMSDEQVAVALGWFASESAKP